jgi:hypothetical protein
MIMQASFPLKGQKLPNLRKPNIEYQIVWNATRRSWDVNREGFATGGFSYDRSSAIGMAIKAAQFEAIEGVLAVVSGIRDGKRKVEWSS